MFRKRMIKEELLGLRRGILRAKKYYFESLVTYGYIVFLLSVSRRDHEASNKARLAMEGSV